MATRWTKCPSEEGTGTTVFRVGRQHQSGHLNRYAFNNLLLYTDPTGLFESRDSAANYADQAGIKVGWFRRNKIVGNSDGSYSIGNRKEHSSITDFGDDIGVQEGVVVSPYDVISVEKEGNLFFGYSETGTRRDGSEVDLTPLSGTAPSPGKFLKGAKGLKVLGEAAKASTKLWPAVSNGRIVINGIEYTTHALERMQPVGTIMKGTKVFSRGVPPSVVENAIKFGKVTPGNTAAEVVRTFENVRVITNPQGTRVISIIKMGH